MPAAPLFPTPRLTHPPLAALFNPSLLAPHCVLDPLGLLHLALTKRDLFLHNWRLLDPDLLLRQWDPDLIIFPNVATGRSAGGWVPLDHDLLASDRYVNGFLLRNDFLADPNFPSLDPLLTCPEFFLP